MADETLLLQLDVGGDSAEAQAALQEVADHLSGLQSAVSGIDAAPLEALGPAGDAAATGLEATAGAGGDAAGAIATIEAAPVDDLREAVAGIDVGLLEAVGPAGEVAAGGLDAAAVAGEAVAGAVQATIDPLSSLEGALAAIDPSQLEAVGSAGDTAAAGASAAGGAAEGAAGGLDDAAAGAGAAEGGFAGLGGAAGDLVGKLGGANEGLGSMSGMLGEVGGLVGGLAAGPAGFAALAVVGVGAFVTLGSAAADYYNELMHLMAATGMTKDQTEIWGTAMEIAGGSSSTLERAAMRLSGTLQDMSAGKISPATTALLNLGISATDSQGNLRSFGDVMPELMEKLSGMQNKTEQSALAADIFGNRFAIQLIPLISNYSYVLGKATEIEGSFGGATQDVTRLALEHNAAQAQLNETYEQFFTRVGPLFIAMLSGLGEGAVAVADGISLADQGLGFFGTSLGDVIMAAPGLSVVQAGLDFKDVLSGDVEKIDDMLLHLSGTEPVVDVAGRALGGLAGGIGSMFGGGSDADKAMQNIENDVGKFTAQIVAAREAADEHLIAAANDIDLLANRAATAGSGFETFRSQAEQSMEGTKEAISGVLPTLDEEFAEWSTRLHEMATDYANFQTNLGVILNALVQAHVDSPEQIILALEEAGPGVTASMVENLAQGGVDAVAETLADLSTVTTTSIEDATDAVLKKTPDWKAKFEGTGTELGSGFGSGLSGALAGIPIEVEVESLLRRGEQALHGSPEYVSYHWGFGLGIDLFQGFVDAASVSVEGTTTSIAAQWANATRESLGLGPLPEAIAEGWANATRASLGLPPLTTAIEEAVAAPTGDSIAAQWANITRASLGLGPLPEAIAEGWANATRAALGLPALQGAIEEAVAAPTGDSISAQWANITRSSLGLGPLPLAIAEGWADATREALGLAPLPHAAQEAGAAIATNLAGGLEANLPAVKAALAAVGYGIAEDMSLVPLTFWGTGQQASQNLAGGIESNLPAISAALKTVGYAIAEDMTLVPLTFWDTGQQASFNLGESLEDSLPVIKAALAKVGYGIAEDMSIVPLTFWDTGQESSSKLGQGMETAATEKMPGTASYISDTIRDALFDATDEAPTWGGAIMAYVAGGMLDFAIHEMPDYMDHIGELMRDMLLAAFTSEGGEGGGSEGGESIPHLARGGVVQRPTLAWLAEGGQPEAVIPLSHALSAGQATAPIVIQIDMSGSFFQGNEIEARRFARQIGDLILQERGTVPAP